jgi:hypothetical protein
MTPQGLILMIRSIRNSLILLGCTLVPPLLAFQQGVQPGDALNQQYPGPLGLANFRKIVSGEFNGNLSRDAVVMNLDSPRLRLSAEYLDTSIGTGSPANDIAVLSGAVAGKDLLVTVEAGGLKLYERTSATSSWNITTVRDASSPWANAWRVAVGDVNGDGCPDIVGVAANKRDLLYLYGTCGLTFTTGPTVVNPAQTIHQLLLMNWTNTADEANNTVEAVFFSNAGWGVQEANGTFRKWVNWTYSLSYGVVMDEPGTGPDRVITTALFAGTDRLSINDETRTEGPYNLGSLGIVAMATGSMTATGTDTDIDLVLTTNTDRDLRIYENQSASTTFDFATPTKFPFGPWNRIPSQNLTGPEGITVGDFDSDGRMDVLAPAQGKPSPGPGGPWGCVPLIRPSTGYFNYQCQIDDPRLIPSLNPGVLPDKVRLTFHPPYTPLLPPPNSGQVLDILINVYDSAGLGSPPSLSPYVTAHIPVPPAQGFQYFIFELPLGYSLANSTGLFSLVAFQELTLNGVMVDRAPATTGMLNPDPNLPVTNVTKDTTQWFGMHREHEETPASGAWDVGPTVPPVPDENEPQEVPPGGG